MPLGRTAAASWGPSAGSLPSSGGASGAAPGERPPRPDQRSCPVMPAPWGALPTELLALVFRQLSSVANAEAGERGVELGEAARLVAALGANREWRAAALQEVGEAALPTYRRACCCSSKEQPRETSAGSRGRTMY